MGLGGGGGGSGGHFEAPSITPVVQVVLVWPNQHSVMNMAKLNGLIWDSYIHVHVKPGLLATMVCLF